MRTVYLGTSRFAAEVLARLAESDHRPALVVTRPPRPRGRGRALSEPPVADLARELGLPLSQPERLNDPEPVAEIESVAPEALCVCAYGALIKEPLLSLAPTFNIHPSLLPRWRGAAPIERAIAAGDADSGVSVMALTEELDAGPVCAVERVPIGPDDDYGAVSERLASVGGDLLVRALDAAAAGSIEWREQCPTDDDPVTYAEKVTRDDRCLDPTSGTALELERMIRALNPHIGCFVDIAAGGPLAVVEAAVAGPGADPDPGRFAAVDGRLLLGTVDGALDLRVVKPAGGKAMDAASYLRGKPVPEPATGRE